MGVGVGSFMCKACSKLVRATLTRHALRCQFTTLGAALEVITSIRNFVASDLWIESITVEVTLPDPPLMDPKESVHPGFTQGV